MSQYSVCRWNWCRNTYPTVSELLQHVQEAHVQTTKPCCLRDIPLHIRAEEGWGESMSGMTQIYGSHSEAPNHLENPSLSLLSPPASSPIPEVQSPIVESRSLQGTPERPAKRRRVMPHDPPLPPSRSNSAQPPALAPPSQRLNRTPSFSTLALPSGSGSAEPIQNPMFPDLDALIAGALRPKPVSTPDRSSQSFSGSDCSVERQLTQSVDMDLDTSFADENLYAGELNWDGEPTDEHPRPRSQTPSQSSQSQSQPRRVSSHPSPASILARQDTVFKAQSSSPAKTYLSGSLDIHSPPQPDGGTVDPRDMLSQSRYFEIASQAASYVLQTQAPYRSQSISQ
ncbi:hypothetical protein B0H17DRAFT_1073243 [Mycena rosella]|uniref:C2H2-type domain-containing protein n=1 Tax=Mycena rosella TaxID=1033263 RepID=A0AAD7GDF9_MYCRO|nr:hypothetical protein B0H17DRAFT_1073243 [Mycena rosella]